MKPGDRIYWLRHDRDAGSHKRVRIPAIFVGLRGDSRDNGSVFALFDGKVSQRAVKLDNLLPRTEEKEIDKAAAGRALYSGEPLTTPQWYGLEWLQCNSGLMITGSEFNGRPSDWPTQRTFDGLERRGLIHVIREGDYWAATLNDLGRALLGEKRA